MGAGKWRDHYADALKGRTCIIIPDNDQAGREHAQQVAQSLQGKAASVKVVELPGLPEKGDVSDFLAAGGTVDQLDELAHRAKEWVPAGRSLPTILVTTAEKQVNDQAIASLARGFRPVPTRVHAGHGAGRRGTAEGRGIPRWHPAADRDDRDRHPARADGGGGRVADDELQGGSRRPIRQLGLSRPFIIVGSIPGSGAIVGVIESPTIVPWLDPGCPRVYPQTRLFYRPNTRFEPIPKSPTFEDAKRACRPDRPGQRVPLQERQPPRHVDCPPAHRDWPTLVRRAGTALCHRREHPRGGKSKLADMISGIASGRRMPRTVWPSGNHVDEEMRKRITSLACRGSSVHAPGQHRLAARRGTARRGTDRGHVGRSTPGHEQDDGRLPAPDGLVRVGNNIQYRGDFVRRAASLRLVSLLEHPEERNGFKYPDVVKHAVDNRARYLRSA